MKGFTSAEKHCSRRDNAHIFMLLEPHKVRQRGREQPENIFLKFVLARM